MPMAWMMGMAGMAGMAYWWGKVANEDRQAFYKLVRDENITDPGEIWDLCCKHHTKLKKKLVEAQARVAEGEEIVRVGHGLAEVRKMMNGPSAGGLIEIKHIFDIEISEEEKSEALKKIEKETVPLEVKRAIIAHWWTELMKLFVPWGLVLPEEIDYVKDPCFRLVGPEVREAVLRMEVFKYKEGYESFKKAFEESMERQTKDFETHLDEREAWRKEKEELLKAYEDLKAEKNAIEANADDQTPDA